MHLINAVTHKLGYFVGASIPPYAILSHVWGEEEVLFQDMQLLETARKKKGFRKIQFTCLQALQDGLQYAWVDTCCINKESSAELSEAINSMFRCWWRGDGGNFETRPLLAKSIWFTRGWTLQELIAPHNVVFVDRNWATIGTKQGNLLEEISRVTAVDREVLTNSLAVSRLSIAKRMSWAANRRTTRKEDEAYCLLGLFDVSMPLIYGEEEGAFVRLQEELIRKSTDQSVFAHSGGGFSLLAKSPNAFDGCANVMLCRRTLEDKPYELTNAGLRITLPVFSEHSTSITVVLNCRRNHRWLVRRLGRLRLADGRTIYYLGALVEETTVEALLTCRSEEISISRDIGPSEVYFKDARGRLLVSSVWIHTRNGAENLTVKVTALDPPDMWDVASPVNDKLRCRIQSSAKLATFSLYGYTHTLPNLDSIPDTGTVTFKLDEVDFEPITLEMHFRLTPNMPLAQKFHCSLELCEFHGACVVQSGVASQHDRSSIVDQLLEPGSFMQVSLRLKRLKITATLEAIRGASTGLVWSDTAFLIHLQASNDEDANVSSSKLKGLKK